MYGLPKYVVTFLRHMEAHQECLKWNITEGSHKLTLTLTWTFCKHRTSSQRAENIWDKIQRVVKLTRTPSARAAAVNDDTCVPQAVSTFLDSSPRKQIKTPLRRQLSWSPFRKPANNGPVCSAERRHMWGRAGPAYSLPSTPATRHSSPPRGSQSGSPTRSLQTSPSRFSWPGGVLTQNGGATCSEDNILAGNDLDCIDGGNVSSPEKSPTVKVKYRSAEELDTSMEDHLEHNRVETKFKLAEIKKQWTKTIKDWPKLMRVDNTVGIETDTDSDTSINIGDINDTVQTCLTACDSILYGHCTDIT